MFVQPKTDHFTNDIYFPNLDPILEPWRVSCPWPLDCKSWMASSKHIGREMSSSVIFPCRVSAKHEPSKWQPPGCPVLRYAWKVVVEQQVPRPDIYVVSTPLAVPFKAWSEHCRLLKEKVHKIREGRRENATRSVGGKQHGQRGPFGGKYLAVNSRSIRVSSVRW